MVRVIANARASPGARWIIPGLSDRSPAKATGSAIPPPRFDADEARAGAGPYAKPVGVGKIHPDAAAARSAIDDRAAGRIVPNQCALFEHCVGN